MRRYLLLLAAFVFACGPNLLAEEPDYARQIQPILTKYCAGCHNDDDFEGKLSLATYAAVRKGGKTGAVLTPEHAELSRMIRMLRGQAKPAMPPPDNERPKENEIALLEACLLVEAKVSGLDRRKHVM